MSDGQLDLIPADLVVEAPVDRSALVGVSARDLYPGGMTHQQLARVERGLHPLGAAIHPEARTADPPRCGACARCYRVEYSRRYYKCDTVKATRGPGTDLRVGWPACELWTARR